MDKIRELLKHLPHYYQVSFALYCAIDAKVYLKAGSKEEIAASTIIELVQKWLNDSSSVSNQELINAAYAASAASAYAAAAYAANAAAYAAYAAAYAAYARGDKLKQYENELIRMISLIHELERIIYRL